MTNGPNTTINPRIQPCGRLLIEKMTLADTMGWRYTPKLPVFIVRPKPITPLVDILVENLLESI